jgi:hypothetical protein
VSSFWGGDKKNESGAFDSLMVCLNLQLNDRRADADKLVITECLVLIETISSASSFGMNPSKIRD